MENPFLISPPLLSSCLLNINFLLHNNDNICVSQGALCILLDQGGKDSLEVTMCYEASQNSPRAFWAFHRLGLLQIHQNKWSDAVQSLQHAIRGYPTSHLWEALGLAYHGLHRFSAALKVEIFLELLLHLERYTLTYSRQNWIVINGEVHVNHKTNAPFSHWNLEELAMQSFLTLVKCTEFRKEDYPGYNNKRGDGNRCDEPFPLGECNTFKFIYNSRTLGKRKRINDMTYRQQRNISFQEIYEAVENLPSSVDLSYYPYTNHFSRLNEAVSSTFGLKSGYTPTSGSYLNNAALVHERVAPFDHCMSRVLLHHCSQGSYLVVTQIIGKKQVVETLRMQGILLKM